MNDYRIYNLAQQKGVDMDDVNFCMIMDSLRKDEGALRKITESLKKVAESDLMSAEESKNIECAALALIFIYVNGQAADFEQFVGQSRSDLSEDQIAHLKSMGIKP